MKKIFSLVCMVAMTLSFMACSDDDDTGAAYTRTSTISVVKSDVLFSAKAGTGSVTVKANGPLEVIDTCSWCKVAATSDSTVSVSVDLNDDKLGRSSLLTIKSGIDSVNVTVQQEGFVFQTDMGTVAAFGDEATEKSYAMTCNGDPQITSTEDWLTVTTRNDSLIVSAAENNTGTIRKGYIKFTYGELKDSVLVNQYDFDKDIAGNYYFAFYNNKGQLSYFASQFLKNNGEYSLSFPALGFSLPVSFDEKNCKVSFTAGSYMGDWVEDGTTYYVYSVLGSSEAGKITYITSFSMAASFYCEEGFTMADFEDTGSWNYVADYLALYLFTKKAPSSANRVGLLINMYSPFLQKMDDSDASAKLHTFAAPSRLSILK